MTTRQRSQSSTAYASKLAHRGWEGAALGADSYLHGTHLSSFLSESARTAIIPAALGACVGLAGLPVNRSSHRRRLVYALLGGALGFGCAVAWHARRLAAVAGSRAWHELNRARDEHWLELHPIDYA